MKKSSPKKGAASKPKAAKKTGLKKKQPSKAQKAELTEQTQRVINGAQELYGKAHQLDKTSDNLHASIQTMHDAVSAMHDYALAGVATEVGAIVTEDKQREKEKPFPVVGVGVSAGRYEAFAEFLSQLPAKTGMDYVLVQHLDPKHNSQLTQLLSHSSKLPVLQLRRELDRVRLDLVATKESMQSIIEEQEATNEELNSANEEIQSSNEELQSLSPAHPVTRSRPRRASNDNRVARHRPALAVLPPRAGDVLQAGGHAG